MTKKKVLFCATIDNHIRSFQLPYMHWLKKHGFEVHVAASGKMELPYCDSKIEIPIARSPYSLINIWAYKKLKRIIDKNKYTFIHCSTPMGGVLTRLAGKRARKLGLKIIYSAHGFHFFKGAQLKNWLLYYPVEKLLAKDTDWLITTNDEDFGLAKTKKFGAGHIVFIPGVGVDLRKFRPISDIERKFLRKKYGFLDSDFLLLYAGELNINKNQGFLIEAMRDICQKYSSIKLLLAGEGEQKNQYCQQIQQYQLEKQVFLLGFRNDIPQLAALCDVGVSASMREGLGINVIEYLACGKPVVVSNIRGHNEIVQEGVNGFLYPKNDKTHFIQCIETLYTDKELYQRIVHGTTPSIQKFGLDNTLSLVSQIYKEAASIN